MSVYLADSSLLIAIAVRDHVHHPVALSWFAGEESDVATCPITEGALLRFLLRSGRSAIQATDVLQVFRGNSWHRFWPDDLVYSQAMLDGVIGHRQVTDSYLVALAAHHGGTLATLDQGLAAAHPEVLLIGA